MALKISDLDAITTPSDADLVHVRNAAGLDKKITYANFQKPITDQLNVISRDRYKREVAQCFANPFVELDSLGAEAPMIRWQNNSVNYTSTVYPEGTGIFRAIEGGAFWFFQEASTGVRHWGANAWLTASTAISGSIVSDELRGAAFSDSGQYGILYIYNSGISYYANTSDYGTTWSARTACTGDTAARILYGSTVWANGYFYSHDTVSNSLCYAAQATPGNIIRVTNSSGVFSEASDWYRLMTANGKVFLIANATKNSNTIDVYKFTNNTTINITPLTISTSPRTGNYISSGMFYRATGPYAGYNFGVGDLNGFNVINMNIAETTLTKTLSDVGQSVGYCALDDADIGYNINHTNITITDLIGDVNGQASYGARLINPENDRISNETARANQYAIAFAKDTSGNDSIIAVCICCIEGTTFRFKYYRNDPLLSLRNGDIFVPASV